jgi:uncharacterized membrane protein
MNKGQGLVEYALILVLVAVVVIVCLAVVIPVIEGRDVCSMGQSHTWQCRDKKVQECLAQERYTKDQCVTLVSGGNP